jgi:hypothetical protein
MISEIPAPIHDIHPMTMRSYESQQKNFQEIRLQILRLHSQTLLVEVLKTDFDLNLHPSQIKLDDFAGEANTNTQFCSNSIEQTKPNQTEHKWQQI